MFSHSGHVMTLANSIIGVGILAMPFCFQKCGIILSVVLLIISNWSTRICCHYLIKSSLLTRRKSFEFLGFHAFGSSGKLLVELCIIGYLLGTCITYFVVVGDLGPQIITKIFSLETGHHVHLRTIIMIVVTVVCILPLGMLKNVDSLTTVCTASIGFYVCLVIKIILESEERIIANDWTEKVVYWEPAGVLQCLPIFSMALSCQMQLFEVLSSVNNQSVEKLNGIVRNATWICTFVYIATGFFGYVAFCRQHFSGNILMNLSPSFGSDVIKIGFILSVAFSFPLVVFPCRASIYSLLYRKGHTDATAYIPETRFKIITVFIVSFALCIALMIPSVELVIGLIGSTIGVAICIMFPAACFRKIVKKVSTERTFAQFIIISGFCLMILGTYANLSAIDEKRSGAHLEELPSLEEKLLRTTKIPKTLGADSLKHLKDEHKHALDDNKITLDLNVQKDSSKPNDLSNKNMKNINLEKPKDEPQPPIIKMGTPPPSAIKSSGPPPLPVDEIHDVEQQQLLLKNSVNVEKSVDKLQAILPVPEEERKEIKTLVVNKTDFKEIPKPMAPAVPVHVVDKPTPKKGELKKVTLQQNIDKDAIKNDEEIAAEESKNIKLEMKSNDDELKKTQNELKKTKELLERTVDELKEEFAKQNKETQNLMVEKLDEVVQKVGQIERKVQQQEPAQQPQPQLPQLQPERQPQLLPPQKPQSLSAGIVTNAADAQLSEKFEDVQPINKGSLLSILSDNQVYEPLSYKTGELIEQVNNGTKLDQRLPLPLVLLINASQIKMNDSNAVMQTKDTKKQLAANLNKGYENSSPKMSGKKVENENEKLKKVALNKGNIEAIRRDILQVNSKQNDITTVSPTAVAAAIQHRFKRDVDTPHLITNDNCLTNGCLTEPKVEIMMAPGSSSSIDFKMQGIGRNLKALNEPEHD